LFSDGEGKRFEIATEREEEVGHKVRTEGGDDAEAQSGDRCVGIVGRGCGVKFFSREEDFAKEGQEALAFGRNEEASGGAFEERGTQGAFDFLDTGGEGGLGEAQGVCGAAEVAEGGDCSNGVKITEGEVMSIHRIS
jgi:hypothetical protein